MVVFTLAICQWLFLFFKLTDYMDQINSLNTSPKPFHLTCLELPSHLQLLNRMMGLFPGAPNVSPLMNDDLKCIFYCMMLPKWQHSCIWCGCNIKDATMTLFNLARSMQELEDTDKKQQAKCNHQMANTGGQSSPCGGFCRHGGHGSPCSGFDPSCHHQYQFQQGPLPQRACIKQQGQCDSYYPQQCNFQSQQQQPLYRYSNFQVTHGGCFGGHTMWSWSWP